MLRANRWLVRTQLSGAPLARGMVAADCMPVSSKEMSTSTTKLCMRERCSHPALSDHLLYEMTYAKGTGFSDRHLLDPDAIH